MADLSAALPRSIVLVENRHSGRSAALLDQAHHAFRREGLDVREVIPVKEAERLRGWLECAVGERPIIVAAGGDGTISAVANYLANTDAVLGILPLGTANDLARALDIPLAIDQAVRLLVTGQIMSVDVGVFEAAGQPRRHFVHAAAIGFGVDFARLATQQSLRERLGRLTYLVATVRALAQSEPFRCTLRFGDRAVNLRLLHLGIMNAPVFGGALELRVPDAAVTDRRLDILAVEAMSFARLLIAALPVLLSKRPRGRGVHVFHTPRLEVRAPGRRVVSLDGELAGHLPGQFSLAIEALRVVAPRRYGRRPGAV